MHKKQTYIKNRTKLEKDFLEKKKYVPPNPPHPYPPELSFLLVICRIVLFYISTKYHQNIVKGIQVTEQTGNQIQTQEGEITPIVRKPELSFLYTTQHVISSCSSFLPSKIKIIQSVLELQSRHEIKFKNKKVR